MLYVVKAEHRAPLAGNVSILQPLLFRNWRKKSEMARWQLTLFIIYHYPLIPQAHVETGVCVWSSCVLLIFCPDLFAGFSPFCSAHWSSICAANAWNTTAPAAAGCHIAFHEQEAALWAFTLLLHSEFKIISKHWSSFTSHQHFMRDLSAPRQWVIIK